MMMKTTGNDAFQMHKDERRKEGKVLDALAVSD